MLKGIPSLKQLTIKVVAIVYQNLYGNDHHGGC